MPRKHAVSITVLEAERSLLLEWSSGSRPRLALRAAIVLKAAGGVTNYQIAKDLSVTRNTVRHWRFRFIGEGIAGLKTRPIPGRPPRRDTIGAS